MSLQARILIAEDEAPLRSLVRMSLEAIGHYVTAVSDGEEALKAFAAEPFDLVILDIMMPRIDGFDACREIRMRSDVPIIMLTALGGTDDMVKGFEMGADDYIAKPFSFKEVQARIHAILRRNQWIQEHEAPHHP
jgi:DNA-binding response OmpR family regulator